MRKFLKIPALLLCVLFVLLGAVGYAYFIEPRMLTVRAFQVETEREIAPCRVVFFTDTHFGKYYSTARAQRLADAINEQDPDIVIFGGDLFDNYGRDRDRLDLEQLQGALAGIRAEGGKFAVWGNHDYGGGAARVYEDFMTACGFEVLNDESRLLDACGIRILGYDDCLMGWTEPELYTIQSEAFNLIVTHEPLVSSRIEGSGDNFMLSGHTHGGQVSIPFLTDRLLPRGSGAFRKGFYSVQQIGTGTSLRMYVSSGIGMTRYPFRFGTVPEIVCVDLAPVS